METQKFLSLGFAAFVLLVCFTSMVQSKPISLGLGKHYKIPTYRNYNRRASQIGVPSIPVGGNVWPVAIYWCFLLIGTPPQPYPVAIDTGSSTLDILGLNCTSCVSKPPNRPYDPSQSSSSKSISCSDSSCPSTCFFGQCSFSNTYETCDLSNPDAPCTISGVWYGDLVTVGQGIKPVPINFGAIQFQTSNFDQFQNIEGVVGLVQSGDKDPTDLFLSLYEAGSVSRNIFAMCLLFSPGRQSNGTITFGDVDTSLYTGGISWTPNTIGGFEPGYAVELKSMTVFGQKVTQVADSTSILDSGTNVLLLPRAAFQAVAKAFYASCNSGSNLVGVCNVPNAKSLFSGNCFQMTPDQVNAFPNITLNVVGVDINMPPYTYLNQLVPSSPNPQLFCLGIRDTGVEGFTIIGDTSMAEYYVIFDNEQNRIGWAAVNKNNCGLQPLDKFM